MRGEGEGSCVQGVGGGGPVEMRGVKGRAAVLSTLQLFGMFF